MKSKAEKDNSLLLYSRQCRQRVAATLNSALRELDRHQPILRNCEQFGAEVALLRQLLALVRRPEIEEIERRQLMLLEELEEDLAVPLEQALELAK